MSKISLIEFDNVFFKSIEGYKKIYLNLERDVCYVILKDRKKVGIIGFSKSNNTYFLKMGIHQDFRGQNILKEALKLLVKKHKIKKIYATIKESNITSIKSCRKLGFRKIPKNREILLKKNDFLKENEIRFVRSF